jgi:uncharacterized coiled-coil protein SlyX
VTDEPDHQIQRDQRPLLRQSRSKGAGVIILVASLAVIAAAAAYLWLNYDRLAQAAFSIARPADPAMADSAAKTVTPEEFQSFQRQTAESLQSAAQDIAAQKADLKSLSDQLSALTAKIDALPSAASPAPQQPAVPARPPVIAARKKPPAPKTTGPISVGGAPLPSAPPDAR